MITTFYCTITTQWRWFWGDAECGFICRCVAMVTVDEMLWVNHEFSLRLEIRSRPPQGFVKILHQREPVKWDSAWHLWPAAFLPTVTSTDSQLTLWHPYPRAFHLKLESSCPWIILSWDRVLEYPGQNYPKDDAERRNGAGSHFGGAGVGDVHKCLFWTESVSWPWPGRHECLFVCVSVRYRYGLI